MRRRGAPTPASADKDAAPRRRRNDNNEDDGNHASADGPPTTHSRAPRSGAAAPTPTSSSSSSPAVALVLTLLLYVVLFLFVRWRFFWTPEPLPFPSPSPRRPLGPALFSEGGARVHVEALAGPLAPPRQVSSPGLRAATDHVARECARLQRALEDAAAAAAATERAEGKQKEGAPRRRSPPRARVAWAEQRVGPGAFASEFLSVPYTNAYRQLTNVLCLLEPLFPPAAAAAATIAPTPAVVLVAHHDAPVASPGAGDDASQVGVMLELLRAYAAAALEQQDEGESEEGENDGRARAEKATKSSVVRLPKAPVLFVFNGGEEPLCQAAHGFALQRDRLPPALALASTGRPPELGAFVNLESIGPGGVPIVFQHSGAWTVRAYARSSPVPRGSGAAQDAFDLGVVVGETDYSRLSYQRTDGGRGWLPGLDLAFIADGAAYHTDRDTVARLRAGVLQEAGEAVGAAVDAMAAELARAASAGDGGRRLAALVRPATTNADGRGGRNIDDNDNNLRAWRRGAAHRAVFFSVGSLAMARYGRPAALFLHACVPSLLIAAVGLALVRRSRSSGLATAAAVGRAAVRAAGALALSVVAPAAVGALRAALSGVAISWYSAHPSVAALVYFPAAAAAMLWASSSAAAGGGAASSSSSGEGQREQHPPPLPTAVLGAAVMNALAAAALTWEGFGCAFIFAAWAYGGALGAGLILAFDEETGDDRRRSWLAASPSRVLLLLLSAVALPALIGMEHVAVFAYVLAGRLNLSGAVAGIAAADAAIGAVAGAGAAACTGGVVAPLVCRASGGPARAWRLAAAMALASLLATAAWASFAATSPYSPAMPKRLLMSRVHFLEQGQQGEGVEGRGGGKGGAGGGSASSPHRHPAAAAARGRVARSGWVFGGTDPNPVGGSVVAAMLRAGGGEAALGLRRLDPSSDPSLPTQHPLGIIYPIDVMADVLLFVEEGERGQEEEQEGGDGREQGGGERNSREPLPSVRLLSDRVAVAGPGDVFQQHRELELVATSPHPCWGLLNVTVTAGGGEGEGLGGGGGEDGAAAARLLWWSLTPADAGPPASHVRRWAGGGSVREHVVRWTSEEEVEEESEGGGGGGERGPRLPMTLRVWPAGARVRVEMHVAPLVGGPRDAARERMAARLPDWAALTWESTTYIGAFEF